MERCSLCLLFIEYGKLINLDSMVLCDKCYKKYNENDYNKRIMPINAIRKYRNLIRELEEKEEK